jgi:hypothetical protein
LVTASTLSDLGVLGLLQLTNLTFLGNAPLLLGNPVFYVAVGATIYYYYGTTGWERLYGGLPTVMLGAPAPQVGPGTVTLGRFGFTITGVVNQTIVVEASTNLAAGSPSGPTHCPVYPPIFWIRNGGRITRAVSIACGRIRTQRSL